LFGLPVALLLAAGVLTACAPTVPATPTDVKATATGLHDIEVEWAAAKDAERYEVTVAAKEPSPPPGIDDAAEVNAASGDSSAVTPGNDGAADTDEADEASGADTTPKETTGTAIAFSDLSADTEYEISIVAVRGEGEKETASEPARTGVATPAPVVPAPSGLRAEAASDTQIDVSWDAVAVTGIEGGIAVTYILEATDAAGAAVLAPLEMTETTYAHEGLPELTAVTYTVRTKAVLDGKTYESPPAEPVTATTREAPPHPEPEPANTTSAPARSGGTASSAPASAPVAQPANPNAGKTKVAVYRCSCGQEFVAWGTLQEAAAAMEAHRNSFEQVAKDYAAKFGGNFPSDVEFGEYNRLYDATKPHLGWSVADEYR
jgi:hypothetical protein